jgi:hypothetical protein
MKTKSNTPIAEVQRWKEGQWAMAVNAVDHGYLPTGDPMTDKSGERYEADFTIVDALNAEEAIFAFTRMTQDPTFDQKVVDNIEVNGRPAIETKPTYATPVVTTIFKPLPVTGTPLEIGEIYSYGNSAVMVKQNHKRTIYAPELIPDLFSFYRKNTDELLWIIGEKVELGWKRWRDGKQYICLQEHQTQVDWTPILTIGVLWDEVPGTPEIPVFVQPTGAQDVYHLGDKVHFPTISDLVYESLIDNNSWSPTEYPSGWLEIAEPVEPKPLGIIKVATLVSDIPTGANITPVDLTDLGWEYEANAIYLFKWIGDVLPANANTGCGFQLNVSTAITQISMEFHHQLTNTGTLTGGSSSQDDVSIGISSGTASASVPTVITGNGMLRTGSEAGTAQLRFRSETTAVTVAKTGMTLIVEKVK